MALTTGHMTAAVDVMIVSNELAATIGDGMAVEYSGELTVIGASTVPVVCDELTAIIGTGPATVVWDEVRAEIGLGTATAVSDGTELLESTPLSRF